MAETGIKRPRISADEFADFTSGPAIADLPKQTRTGLDPEKGAALLSAVQAAMAQGRTVSNNRVYTDTEITPAVAAVLDAAGAVITPAVDAVIETGKDAATRVGDGFIRLLNAALEDAKETGSSGRLTVYKSGDGYAFAVTLGIAREGKGVKRGPRVSTLTKLAAEADAASAAAPDDASLIKAAKAAHKTLDAAIAARNAK